MKQFYNERELHAWIASGFYGDTIIDVCKTKQNIINFNKDSVVFHTGKMFWHPNNHTMVPANTNVLSFLNSLNFVKGLIFDFDQTNFSKSIDQSNYKVDFTDCFPIRDWKNDIRKDVNFDLFPSRFTSINQVPEKIAVLHPLSFKNKPPHQFEEYYLPVWKQTLLSLHDNNYKIILIGGDKDEEVIGKYYPELLEDNNILNFINKLSFFESLDLVWNYSDLNVSCCSWTAWYSKAAGIKTAMASGYDMVEDLLTIRTYKYELVGNNHCCLLDFANKKEECDRNIANWINEL